MPASTISTASSALVPCGEIPLSVPYAMRTPALCAFSKLPAMSLPTSTPMPTATPSLPDAAVPAMYETFRGSVNTWECNEFGTMERRFFISRFSDAASHIFRELGVNQEMRRERNIGTAALDYRLTYRKPLHAGDAIIVKSGVLELRDKTVRFGHHLIDAGNGEVACSIEIVAVFFDLGLRKSIPLPEEIRENAASHMIFESA